MAGMNGPAPATGWPEMREQLAAVARLRWRIFANSLRSLRGRLEMVSGILMGAFYAMIGFGGMLSLGVAAWILVSRVGAGWLAAPLWGVFLFWQLFPLWAAAFGESFDSSNFLRFPLRYRPYLLIRMAFSLLEPPTLVCTAWLLGMAVGIAVASERLLLWAVPALAAFWMFNFFLARAIFAWAERWLAKRRTREILGILFFLCIIGVQFIGPLLGVYGKHRSQPLFLPAAARLLAIERALPPGLVARVIARAERSEYLLAAGSLALVCVYAGAFFGLLNVRLRAQYRGESLSEAPAPAASRGEARILRAGWELPGFSGPVSAVFEKEFRYLSRSGPILFTLVMPMMVLLILRVTAASAPHGKHGAIHFNQFAFPAGAAYAMLILTGAIFNSLGAEGVGVQAYFASPMRPREIMLGKNLMQGAVLALEIFLVWAGACLLFGPPAIGIALATLAGILFAAPVNLAAGNLVSLTFPQKVDLAMMGRQRSSGVAAFAALGVQAVTLGVAAGIVLVAAHGGRLWLATPVFLALAVLAFAGYALVLERVDAVAFAHREAILAELCRS